MKSHLFSSLVVLICLLLFGGCITNLTDNKSATIIEKKPTTIYTESGAVQTLIPVQRSAQQVTIVPSAQISSTYKQSPGAGIPPGIERESDMDGFIRVSFPKVTELYTDIKKSRIVFEWKQIQEKAIKMQIFIQDLTRTYQLDISNPEKNVFRDLDSRHQIVMLKYLHYLDDMEGYATNLNNAVYYQEKGTDPQSAQTSLRYQGQSDQFEKQAIADIKTISEYCNDFRFTFLNQEMVREYRYLG
jgi:hypothetical protein